MRISPAALTSLLLAIAPTIATAGRVRHRPRPQANPEYREVYGDHPYVPDVDGPPEELKPYGDHKYIPGVDPPMESLKPYGEHKYIPGVDPPIDQLEQLNPSDDALARPYNAANDPPIDQLQPFDPFKDDPRTLSQNPFDPKSDHPPPRYDDIEFGSKNPHIHITCNVNTPVTENTAWYETFDEGLIYLRGLPQEKKCGSRPGHCERVSCSRKSAIWLCYDEDHDFDDFDCAFVADAAEHIMKKCVMEHCGLGRHLCDYHVRGIYSNSTGWQVNLGQNQC